MISAGDASGRKCMMSYSRVSLIVVAGPPKRIVITCPEKLINHIDISTSYQVLICRSKLIIPQLPLRWKLAFCEVGKASVLGRAARRRCSRVPENDQDRERKETAMLFQTPRLATSRPV